MLNICVLCILPQIMHRLAYLVLEDGTVFSGRAVGAPGVASGEACFTTAMAGYEEAVTDPSYVAQVLCFSYPLIGNYGIDPARLESEAVQCEGVVVRRARPAFAEWLTAEGVVALEEVDTRALVRRIRDGGVLRCALGDAPVEELRERALAEPFIDGRPLDEPEFLPLSAGIVLQAYLPDSHRVQRALTAWATARRSRGGSLRLGVGPAQRGRS